MPQITTSILYLASLLNIFLINAVLVNFFYLILKIEAI